MAKMVKCKGCGAEIYKGVKKCPQCGKKNKKHTGLIFLGVCIALIIIFSVIGRVKSDSQKNKERRTALNWPTRGIAALLPEPQKEYGRISGESENYFFVDVYFVSQDEFNAYVGECKMKGFIVDYSGSASYYMADDEAGNSLSLSYDEDEEEMRIHISSAPEKDKEAKVDDKEENESKTEENTQTESDVESTTENVDNNFEGTKEQSNNLSEEAVNNDFRKWVDEYEEFMNRYVDFIENYDSSDFNALMQYSEFMTEYADFIASTEKLDEGDYSASDWAYYVAAQGRVLEKLSKIQGR